MRIALLVTVVVAAAQSPAAVAAHQVATNIWGLLALALDAIAIAAQTLTGQALGAGDAVHARALTRLMTWWGAGAGLVLGLFLLAGHQASPPLFTPDPAVRSLLATVLLVQALWQPVNGVVFVLDGVLIGAGDARYLALAGVVTLVVFVPLALVVWHSEAGLTWLWWAFGAFMAARFATLVLRARGTRVDAPRSPVATGRPQKDGEASLRIRIARTGSSPQARLTFVCSPASSGRFTAPAVGADACRMEIRMQPTNLSRRALLAATAGTAAAVALAALR